MCDGDGSSCAVFIESSLSTEVDESELEDLEVFEENFESLLESQLALQEVQLKSSVLLLLKPEVLKLL